MDTTRKQKTHTLRGALTVQQIAQAFSMALKGRERVTWEQITEAVEAVATVPQGGWLPVRSALQALINRGILIRTADFFQEEYATDVPKAHRTLALFVSEQHAQDIASVHPNANASPDGELWGIRTRKGWLTVAGTFVPYEAVKAVN